MEDENFTVKLWLFFNFFTTDSFPLNQTSKPPRKSSLCPAENKKLRSTKGVGKICCVASSLGAAIADAEKHLKILIKGLVSANAVAELTVSSAC